MNPDDPRWMRTMTASKAAAVLGLSPWASPWLLWCRMKGIAGPDTDNAVAKQRGHDLEGAVLDWWLRDTGATEMARQLTAWAQPFDDDWACATPDMHAERNGKLVLVDAKTDRKSYGWDELPAHYQVQGLFQLGCDTQASSVEFPTLHAGLDVKTYVVDRDDELVNAIMDRCRAFWLSLAGDEPPDLSGDACEYDIVRKLHPQIDQQTTAVIDPILADAYLTAQAGKEALPGLKARVLEQMGRAQYATTGGVRIARRQPAKGGVSLHCLATPADIEGTTP